jgi:hypothetical protein
MLSNFSWQQFALFAGVSLVLYLAVVLILYWRKEICSLFKAKEAPAVIDGTEDLVGKIRQEEGLSHVSMDELHFGPDLQGRLPDCLEELKWCLDEAGRQHLKREMIPAFLKPVLLPYGDLLKSDLGSLIREHIQAECQEQLGFTLSDNEIEASFPNSNSFGKLAAITAAIGLSFWQMRADAQDGNAGITQATTMVKGYFDTGCNLMYAIGAVVGIIGAIKVYQKWNAGEPDTGKVAASWFGSCIFLVVVATVIKSFFGL